MGNKWTMTRAAAKRVLAAVCSPDDTIGASTVRKAFRALDDEGFDPSYPTLRNFVKELRDMMRDETGPTATSYVVADLAIELCGRCGEDRRNMRNFMDALYHFNDVRRTFALPEED